jgi:hypothetical protein
MLITYCVCTFISLFEEQVRVEIKVFKNLSLSMEGSGSVQIITDPEGPKNTDPGSGSETLEL